MTIPKGYTIIYIKYLIVFMILAWILIYGSWAFTQHNWAFTQSSWAFAQSTINMSNYPNSLNYPLCPYFMPSALHFQPCHIITISAHIQHTTAITFIHHMLMRQVYHNVIIIVIIGRSCIINYLHNGKISGWVKAWIIALFAPLQL